jgi:hypothetical protein
MIENKEINRVMNNFNRLSYTYRFILIEKILFDYNRKGSKFCVFKKNAYICNTEKTIKAYDYERRN